MTQRQQPPPPEQASGLGQVRQRRTGTATKATEEPSRKAPTGAIDLLRGRAFEEQTLTAHSDDLYEEEEDEYQESWPGRLPSSSRRYLTHAGQDGRQRRTDGYPQASPPRRRTTVDVRTPAKETPRLKRTRFHPLVFVGLGLFMMIIGWLSFSALSSWWSVTQDDWQYGRPRTYQTDAVVGHGDSASHPSHFIALNLNGQVLVLEIPGGNAAKVQVYIGPRLFGAGEDLAPVTLSFEDCNGDGKPDLNLHIQGSNKIICFPNNGKTFTTTTQQQP